MITRISLVLAIAGLALDAIPLKAAGNPGQTKELIRVLESDASLSAKARACQRLGEFGTAEAVPILATLLSDEVLSTYARAGLERIPDLDAVAALRAALNSIQGSLRIGVIHSLAALQDEASVGALSELIEGSDSGAAKAALLALGRIANEAAVKRVEKALLSGIEELRPDAAAACLLAAEKQLKLGNSQVARSLYNVVRRADVSLSYRIGATRGAILARTRDQVPFLIRQLESHETAIRDVALLTIREIPSEELAEALIDALESAPPDLQTQIIGAMQICHVPQTFASIRGRIEDANPHIRHAALTVLTEIGRSADARVLLNVLKDPRDPRETSMIVNSLSRMEGAEVDDLILRALASATDAEVQINLIQLLRNRNVEKATDELLEQAGNPSEKVSVAAYQAMKPFVDPSRLPALIKLAKASPNESVRAAAASTIFAACTARQDFAAEAELILSELKGASQLDDRDIWLRVLTSLGYAKALPTITGTLADADADWIANAIGHLGRWPNPAPVEALFDVVDETSDSNLRRRALAAIIQLTMAAADRDQESDEVLAAWLQRANRSVRSIDEKRRVIAGLGRVQDSVSLKILTEYLRDPEVEMEAAYAFVSAALGWESDDNDAVIRAGLRRISRIENEDLQQKVAALKREMIARGAKIGADSDEP